ncbi:MAG: hypothetical protein IJ039_09435 [Clostridia bacterium]|nr:hypothetical protein [Clostridia bacterium]
MDSMIYNPLEEYENKFCSLHLENATKFFDGLVKKSGIDIDANRRTVAEYVSIGDLLKKTKKRLGLWKFLRVLMFITLILIPLAIIKVNPLIKRLQEEIAGFEEKQGQLLDLASSQMQPLNDLFTDRDCIDIIESTIPLLDFAPYFSVEQEADMIKNYDFGDYHDSSQSAIDILSGRYNGNPFLFENKFIHTMGTETYHGYKTIFWTESVRGRDGKRYSVTRSQTLHASVTKPKPYYHTQVVLDYCALAGDDLRFTRDATHLDRKGDKEIERYIKRGEKKLQRLDDQAVEQNDSFTSMSNSDFEVLFDALDRTNEVQFRLLFTPLAQTNMVDLIRSKTGYGDDFTFIKENKTNRIISVHSQGRAINLLPQGYMSYSYDISRNSFIEGNKEYFRAVYFDLAPILAIPVYQERPVHSLMPIPDYSQTYSSKECEALANCVDARYVVHPDTKTQAILKSTFIKSDGDTDKVRITAFSYDVVSRVDYITVFGGDRRYHSIPVYWDEYIPLEAHNDFFVGSCDDAAGKGVIATRKNLCIYR